MIRISGIKLAIDRAELEIKERLLARLKIRDNELVDYSIFKRSIDARRREQIFFVYTVDAVVSNEQKVLSRFKEDKDIVVTPNLEYEYVVAGWRHWKTDRS
ncbi:hypothetical protein N752_21755 [Desulforamulus aquiferis]|nr:hypothetical protein N752_21755 [Desulforamulus aquiferis]